jgi:hypothetical protein
LIGVLPIHMKIGRQAFLSAVESAAPGIEDPQRQFFETSYDNMAAAMMGRKHGPQDLL